jgi:hypothetical protein
MPSCQRVVFYVIDPSTHHRVGLVNGGTNTCSSDPRSAGFSVDHDGAVAALSAHQRYRR